MSEWAKIGEQVIELAQKLVATPSVVDSDGEADAANLLERYLTEQTAELEHVRITAVDVDKPTHCRVLMAYAPAASETRKTILLMGHIDTVGLEPYKSYSDIAFDSDKLKEQFTSHSDPAVAAAAQSPNWAFGRGWLDMKGGVAAIVEVFLNEARKRSLDANLLLLLTPDEESASLGLRALVPELAKLKHEHNLEFVRVINADYTAPLFDGDEQRYFYSGTVGKLLVGLSVFGATTHVGETFDGVNASSLTGYLSYAMEHNRRLLAGVGGEWLPPPTVLHMGDSRERYDVMTVEYAKAYVNLFHLGDKPKDLWRGILYEVRRLAKLYDREMRLRYNRFTAKADIELPRYRERAEVVDFAELLKRAKAHTADCPVHLERLMNEANQKIVDERERALYIIRGLHGLLPPGRPLVVVSLLPPFYPAQIAQKGEDGTKRIKEFCLDNGLSHRRVYPYIADMSYFAFDDVKGLALWQAQSPLWLEQDEVAGYVDISAPVCNLGPWGSGAHSAEERVYLPYLRDELPRLLTEALYRFAG